MKRAFSLIELSIVILIIGILIAGVTQGSRLVSQMRLSSARAQTQSSPAASIKGLIFWIESTSEKSFLESETEENANISRWNDINPQNPFPSSVTKTASAAVQYRASGINNLPSVYFGGTAGANNFFSGTMLSNAVDKSFSLFVVYKNDDSTSNNYRNAIFNGNATGSPAGWVFSRGGGGGSSNNKRCLSFYGVADYCGSVMSQNAEVASLTYNGTTLDLYSNGISGFSNSANMTTPVPGGVLVIGGVDATSLTWLGNIGEIIVYDRKLKTEERQAVEKYLGKKWGVKVS